MEKWQEKLTDWLFTTGPKLLQALLVLAVGLVLLRLILKVTQKAMEHRKLDVSLQKFLLRTVRIAGYVVLAISVLSTLNVSTTSLIAGFSAAAAAVALALKDSLSNVAAGIILLFTHPFETGDFIAAGGEQGTVRQIDLIHTTLVTLDNRRVVMPNGPLAAGQIVNFSSEPLRRVDLIFPVSYEADAVAACRIAQETAAAHALVLTEPESPFARVSEYGDSAVNLTVRVWCRTPDYWTVRFDLTESIRAAFDAAGVVIPYNQLDVHIVPPDTGVGI